MIIYKEYEKEVYNWLNTKNEKDSSFTFSLRQNGSKGAELDYFIGTEKSRYFAVTFWTLPVGFPGSSGDCIGLVFKLSKDYLTYSYDFKFTQTNSPSDTQNTSALNLIKLAAKDITESIGSKRISADDNKMFTIRSKPKQDTYTDLTIMLKDVDEDLLKLIPIINTQIQEEKKVNPAFEAHRISTEEFNKMNDKLKLRFEKYNDLKISGTNKVSEKKEPITSKNETNITPKNQILYGPPGTGKTYKTKEIAVQISNPSFVYDTNWSIIKRREEIVKEYDRLYQKGLIIFTTFHQSVSYEDFIEGIKPIMKEDDDDKELGYEIQDGIFKELCNSSNKKISVLKHNENSTTPFDIAWDKLIDSIKKELTQDKLLKIGSWDYGLSSKESLKYESLNSPSKYTFTITKKNIYDTYQNKLARPSGAFQKDMRDILNFIKSEFHLGEFKDDLDQEKKQSYQNFVLIIDEINRGNVSAIFGELITLLEPDKRLDQHEAITLTLPYSKEKFGIPSNLHIIGTMNTADRSVEALDTALRRRFEFKEMMPDYKVIENEEVNGVQLSEVLKTINERIELLIDRDHTIGHSYFFNVNSEKKLATAFNNKIVPLLQEYFYGDYGKIGLVLGKGFVEKQKNDKIKFADFTYENANDFITSSYTLKKVESDTIIAAVLILLGKKETE